MEQPSPKRVRLTKDDDEFEVGAIIKGDDGTAGTGTVKFMEADDSLLPVNESSNVQLKVEETDGEVNVGATNLSDSALNDDTLIHGSEGEVNFTDQVGKVEWKETVNSSGVGDFDNTSVKGDNSLHLNVVHTDDSNDPESGGLPSPPLKPAVQEERAGCIQFRVVNNDGVPVSTIILTGLKCIFQKQLPKMPKDYIARLVYDRSHLSMAMLRCPTEESRIIPVKSRYLSGTTALNSEINDGKFGSTLTLEYPLPVAIGGITYRPFAHRGFAEIVFCAVSSDQQVKGYGAHLMAHVKDYISASTNGQIKHLLTYADNYAIGYFMKQGFSKHISLPRSCWAGYIKDYEGGTLMQCDLIPRIRYLLSSRFLLKQREIVNSKIRAISRSHLVHPPPAAWKKFSQSFKSGMTQDAVNRQTGSPNAVVATAITTTTADTTTIGHVTSTGSASSADSINNSSSCPPPLDPLSIPAIREAGWSSDMDELARVPRHGPNYTLLLHLLNSLLNHPQAWPFLAPVNRDDVADYYDVIKSPMDLSTMESKLESDVYNKPEDFIRDAMLIFNNCRKYNGDNTPYAKAANRLEKFMWSRLREVPEWSHLEPSQF